MAKVATKRKMSNGSGGRTVQAVKKEKPVVIGSNSMAPRRRVEYDPELDVVLDLIKNLKPSEVSLASGNLIGANTIRNWRRGKVRTPLNYTIKAAYKASGYELVLKRIK